MNNKLSKENFNLDSLANSWPAPLVARDQRQLDKFSGGILNARSLANADCLGVGPKGRIKFGRKVAYDKYALVEWLKGKMEAE